MLEMNYMSEQSGIDVYILYKSLYVQITTSFEPVKEIFFT